MGIMSRFVRIWRSDVHGVMDQLEDKALVLKQSLREMEEELLTKEARLKKKISVKEQLARELKATQVESEKIESDINIAVKKNKDDIARMLIKKQKIQINQGLALKRRIEDLEIDIASLSKRLEEQRTGFNNYRLQAAEYLSKAEQDKWDESMPDAFRQSICFDPSDEEVEIELLRRKETDK